jgi:hypothetical protein
MRGEKQPKITPNLKEPSPTRTICLEIKVACIHCNTFTPFRCKMDVNPKESF